MEELTLIDMIKDLKDNYEKQKNEKDYVKEFKDKYRNVLEKYDISCRFKVDGFNNNPLQFSKINFILKNDVQLRKMLNYKVSNRSTGYYFLIANLDQNPINVLAGTGYGFLYTWYNSDEYSEFVQDKPYWAAIQKLEENGEEIKYINKQSSYTTVDINNCSAETLDAIIQELKKVLSYYPDVMTEYIDNNCSEEMKKAFEKKYDEQVGHDQGKLFTIYIWTLMKVEKGLDPVDLKKDEYKNLVNDEEDSDNNENTIKGKNLIIYGVPGSGKSYSIKENILENISEEQYERIIFYPEYTYYDFVGQMIPNENGNGLEFEQGPFVNILKKALADEERPYYLIIEEMNRGNAEAIFGDILQLLDRDMNGKSVYSISNKNIEKVLKEELDGKKVFLPSNLYIYATINNSDQNVFNLDTAFSRRWEYEIKPCDGSNDESSKKYLTQKIRGTEDLFWNDLRQKINKKIMSTEEIYNKEDKRLGLYYIDADCLEGNNTSENEEMYREKFASKIFRYLWLDVFKNCRFKIFKNADETTLEDIIFNFKKHGKIDNILIFEREN